MPSYRVTAAIGLLQPGVAAPDVLPQAVATAEGIETAAALEERANLAMREYVMERPHTATVYGLVAAMQSGRFTVEDLLRFIAEGPGDGDQDG